MNKWILTQNNELVNLCHVEKFYISSKTCTIYGITGQKNDNDKNISIKVKIVSPVPENMVLTEENQDFYEMKCGMILELIIKFLDSDKTLLDLTQPDIIK